MTSGQSNPVFQSSTRSSSSRLASTHISQPTFLESSVSQPCKPLFSAATKPQTGALKPCRAAPTPPKKEPAESHSSKVHQVARTFMQSPNVSKLPIYSETKPLPPSRPLPPLASKPNTKPKPPMPPLKPKPPPVQSALPHTQLLGRKAPLMPPSRPR